MPGDMPIPVILDTDIGLDVDDVWALAFMLRCPELDIRLIVTDTGDTHYSARLVAIALPHGLAIVAVFIALLGATVGFILAETLIYTPFMMDMAFKRILSLQGVIVFGFSGYFTYIIARRSSV